MNRIKNILAKTYTDKMKLYRYSVKKEGTVKTLIYDGIPCAISRSAHVHSPTPVEFSDNFPQVTYRLRVYAQPEVRFHLGDYVEITREGETYIGTVSDGFYYDSHSISIVAIEEVRYDKA